MLEKERTEHERLHKKRIEMMNRFNKERDSIERGAEDKIETLKEDNEKQMKKLFQDLDNSQSI